MEQKNAFKLVYFGDSLTDDGNTFAITEETLNTAYPPIQFGYAEKFTNGHIYAGITSEVVEADEYINYAFGGAEAVGTQSLERYLTESGIIGDVKNDDLLDVDINLSAQISRFLTDHAEKDLSGVTASILIGANDYRNFAPTSSDPSIIYLEAIALIQNVVSTTISNSVTLLQSGVGTVMVNTLPPADFFPFMQSLPDELQNLSRLAFDIHNQALTDAVEAIAQSGASIQVIDLGAISTEILLDPSTFGFIAPLADSVLFDISGDPSAPPYDADQIAFFDEVHLTEAGHGVWAMFQVENLTSHVFLGDDASEVLLGSQSHDLVISSSGDDSVELYGGDDVAIGGLGADTVRGGNGDDIIAGGSGNDNLAGGNGNDFLSGGNGDDSVEGGNGNDVLVDGLGHDWMFGGNGDDVFLFAEAKLIGGLPGSSGDDVFDGGNGHDVLRLALTEETSSLVDALISAGNSMSDALLSIGIDVIGIEEFHFVDSRTELGNIGDVANVAEADLWGFI